ncbi:MAG: RIP metalloprotease RseP [Thermodesulfobacteriota bacterium]
MTTTVISFVIVLGILIFIHELGHFTVAKLCGVGVEKFSLGFGPKLVGVTRGETEYLISLLPLGGYVKMVGEAPGEEVSDEVMEKSFTHKSVAKRSAIVAAGPIMNLILMFCLMPIIYMIGIQEPAYLSEQPLVGYVEKGSAAEESGLRKGDVITAVNGSAITKWEQLKTSIVTSPDAALTLEIARKGETLSMDMKVGSSRQTGEGVVGLYPPMAPLIGGLSKGYPAEKAGIKSGDRIVRIGDAEITHWAEVQEFIGDATDELPIIVEREGELVTVQVKPKWNEESKRALIGVSLLQDNFITKKYGFIDSIGYGLKRAWELTVFTFVILKKLFTGDISMKSLGGPIMIAQVAGQAAESGISAILSLMAFLSLQLGILNLLPIPVLDGGHLFFFGIERLRGKPVSERVMIITQQVGMALLLLLMVVVTYNDIRRLFGI